RCSARSYPVAPDPARRRASPAHPSTGGSCEPGRNPRDTMTLKCAKTTRPLGVRGGEPLSQFRERAFKASLRLPSPPKCAWHIHCEERAHSHPICPLNHTNEGEPMNRPLTLTLILAMSLIHAAPANA